MKERIVIISLASAFAAIATGPAAARAAEGESCPAMAGQARAQAAPRREAADKLFYLQLGGAGTPAGGMHGGPDLGIGMRFELGRIGIDASMNIGVTQTGPRMEITGLHGSWAKLGAQYCFMPDADATPYLGASLGWGGQRERVGNDTYAATGLQMGMTAGYEMLRSSTIRMFVQADMTMPLYRATTTGAAAPPPVLQGAMPAADVPMSRYLPMMGLSIGLAWGRPHVVGVEKIK